MPSTLDAAPLRIAYFTHWGQGNATGPGDGVRKKISGQIQAQLANGAETKLFVLTSRPSDEAWAQDLPRHAVETFVYDSRLARERVSGQLGAAIARFSPGAIYSRQDNVYPALVPTLRRFPLVIELNGNDVEELRHAPTYYRVYQRISREVMARLAAGFVAVSNEFVRLAPYGDQGRPMVVIANGIDLSLIEPLPPPPRDPTLRFAFIGGMFGAIWHGVPKIIELARRRPDWMFDVIGMSQEELGIPALPNLTAHGTLARPAYRAILARADAAFGSLSAHVKKNHEGSALKTREYLAHGIPTIIGYLDTDFLEEVPFLLRLPNTPENVATNVDRIERFAREWKGRRVDRADVLHLDVATKERRRLDFLRTIAERHAARRLAAQGRRG